MKQTVNACASVQFYATDLRLIDKGARMRVSFAWSIVGLLPANAVAILSRRRSSFRPLEELDRCPESAP